MKKVCAYEGCGVAFTPSRIGEVYCINHALHNTDRSRSNPQVEARRQKLYQSRRWRITRKIVFERDGHQCVLCEATELERPLLCDHIGGIDWDDPFNPDKCRTLCSTCSGKEDGKRGASSRRTQATGGHL